jgi:hypothetical protein
MPPIYVGLGTDTALAAIPARYELECGWWDEAARLPVRASQFPAAQSISYFARALGAARANNTAAARAEIVHLDEIETRLNRCQQRLLGRTNPHSETSSNGIGMDCGRGETHCNYTAVLYGFIKRKVKPKGWRER